MIAPGDPIAVRNNLFTNGTGSGFQASGLENIDLTYNNAYGNTPDDWAFVTPDGTNISRDPFYHDAAAMDFHLGAHSGAIDAGDPLGPADPDGSRADQGAFGGPGADFEAPTYADDLFVSNLDDTTLHLAWSEIPGASLYHVYGSSDGDFVPGPGSHIGTSASPEASFDHSPLTVCSYYRVAGVNSSGYSGGWSNLAGDCLVGDEIDPVVEIVFPAGTPRFYVGHTMAIQWIATDNEQVDSVGIWLSVNAGADYERLFSEEPNDSICEWVIPMMDADSCVVKVVAWDGAMNSGEGVSHGYFSIKDQTAVGEDEEEEDETPVYVTALEQNFPNPFNGVTSIAYTLAEPGNVDLRIYDTAGRLIRTLEASVSRSSGRHVVTWNGHDDAGRAVTSGVYFAMIRAGKFRQTRKMVYLR
jgi:hypothetical protein